jgi:hypothetical protein
MWVGEEGMKVNYVRSFAKTIDDFLDNIGLGRPLEKIIDFFEATAPSRIARKAGLPPAPGEAIDSIVGHAIHELSKAKVPKPFEEVEETIKRITKPR